MKVILNSEEVVAIATLLRSIRGNEQARELSKKLIQRRREKSSTEDYQVAAMRLVREGELEVDDDATVSHGDSDGAYVMAWLWIHRSEMLVCRKERHRKERKKDRS